MGRSTLDAWISGPTDLKEADVEDVPVPGDTVRVRGLPAAFSNQAQSEALEYRQVAGSDEAKATINSARMEVIQFAHGVVEPKFTVQQAEQVAQRFGPAFRKVIEKIDELSGVDKEAIEQAEARFPSPNGEPAATPERGRPDVRPRAVSTAGDDKG